MITADRVSITRLVGEIWRPLLCYLAWNLAVMAVWWWIGFRPLDLPLALIGSALGLFLGFRANAAYARWWEARTLWGSMINASRSFAREIVTAFADPARQGARDAIVHRQIAYVHALRCQLRRLPIAPDVGRFLPPDEVASAVKAANPANGLLVINSRSIDRAAGSGMIAAALQIPFTLLLRDISNAQGGMERIKSTPLPVHYRLLPELFTTLFCLILPFGLLGTLGGATPLGAMIVGFMFFSVLRIGADLADPFADGPHDVPMDAMTRTIEIDLRETLGEAAPPPLHPVDHVLS